MPSNYQIELKSLQKQLDILQQENIMMKNKIAEIINNDMDSSVLERVEIFLNSFIEKDAILALIRKEIADEMKDAGYPQKEENTGSIQLKQNSLRRDMDRMEREFRRLRNDFDSYIAQFTPAA